MINVRALGLALSLYACDETYSHSEPRRESAPPAANAGTRAEPPLGAAGARAASSVASTCRPFVKPADCADAEDGGLPDELRCTGLYGDWEAREIACEPQPYQPAYQLWSDGAKKRRFAALPDGATIDVSDANAFLFPVGTRLWKEFSVETTRGLQLAETRLLLKTSAGWLYTTYVWSQDAERARRNDDGLDDLFATGHAVPSHKQCAECHEGRRDFVLGWDALLLGPGATGLTSAALQAAGRLTIAARNAQLPQTGFPGNATERAALGYLHVNCGVSCHNSSASRPLPIALSVESSQAASVQDTAAVRTAINRSPGFFPQLLTFGQGGPYYDIRPGDPARSMIVVRMSAPAGPLRMPRLGSAVPDDAGVRAVSAWIAAMSGADGYPTAAP